MAIVLKSKPGLSSTTTLNIPTTWDATWFRNLISNQLKGADVRNADGANGISVTGTIASPYATITFGPGPIVLTTAPGTVALTINGATGQDALDVEVAGTLIFSVNAAGIFANTWGSQSGIQTITASSGLQITAGPISGRGPVSGTQVDMTPDTGTFTVTYTGFTTTITGTAKWVRIGGFVILTLPAGNGTSNATSFTATGLPAAIQPATAGSLGTIAVNAVQNSGLYVPTSFTISGGIITFYNGASESGSSWTGSGTKGFFDAAFAIYSIQ